MRVNFKDKGGDGGGRNSFPQRSNSRYKELSRKRVKLLRN